MSTDAAATYDLLQPGSTESTVVTDETCLTHEVPPGFPECPQRLRVCLEALEQAGRPTRSPADVPAAAPATLEADALRGVARRLHVEEYLERLEETVAVSTDAAQRVFLDGSDNPVSPGTAAAAWAALRCALAGGAAVMGDGGHAFSLARPPGHHCEADRAMGFCFLNQVALLAQWLIDVHGVERVAILDFDVHHGNGTQHLFEQRPDVFYLSVHQDPFYPGTGGAGEIGVGAGIDATLNVPLPAGSGDDAVLAAIRDTLLPAIHRRGADVLLVSAGFDAWRGDPLGGMSVSREGFRTIGAMLAECADALAGGRMVSVLEGGYDLDALGGLLVAYLEGTEGRQAESGA